MLTSSIFSIGYGNRKIEDFLNLIVRFHISLVVDVRSKPYSRFQPVYNKNKLSLLLESVGSSYLFKGEDLGGKPKNGILYTNGKLNYNLVCATKSYNEALSNLIQLAANGEKICLLCCELNPNNCHRKTLLAESLMKQDIIVNHITATGTIEKHTAIGPLF
jgi:uncharacterized protein (DUF488 family)